MSHRKSRRRAADGTRSREPEPQDRSSAVDYAGGILLIGIFAVVAFWYGVIPAALTAGGLLLLWEMLRLIWEPPPLWPIVRLPDDVVMRVRLLADYERALPGRVSGSWTPLGAHSLNPSRRGPPLRAVALMLVPSLTIVIAIAVDSGFRASVGSLMRGAVVVAFAAGVALWMRHRRRARAQQAARGNRPLPS